MFGSGASPDPGTGPEANNLTPAQNPYAPNMVPGPYGAAVQKPASADPFKELDNTKNKPVTATNFSVGGSAV